MTLHAAWMMDTEGARAARKEISLIKFFGAERAARRGRPRAADPRRRWATRPTCRSRPCTATRAPRASTTARTRSTASRWRPDPARLRAAGRRCPSEHVPTRREAARAEVRRPAGGGDGQRLSRAPGRAVGRGWWSRSPSSSCSAAGLVVVAIEGFAHRRRRRREQRGAGRGGARGPRARVDRFDAARALALLRRQLGLRPAPGRLAAAARAGRACCARCCPTGASRTLPGSPACATSSATCPAAGRRSSSAPITTREYDPVGFVGANDSAAGTAAVIELARALRAAGRATGREVRFVLFDGEEEGPGGTEPALRATCALRGSRAYVAAHAATGSGEMILLDYIANSGVRLPREGSSDRALWARLRAAAQQVGVGAVFPSGDQVTIFDDHTPFLRAGIPAIDLIDFSYRYERRRCRTRSTSSRSRAWMRWGRRCFALVQRVARGLSGDGRAGGALRCEHGGERLHDGRVELRAGARGAARRGPRRRGARGRYGRSDDAWRRRRRRRRRSARRAGCPRRPVASG